MARWAPPGKNPSQAFPSFWRLPAFLSSGPHPPSPKAITPQSLPVSLPSTSHFPPVLILSPPDNPGHSPISRPVTTSMQPLLPGKVTYPQFWGDIVLLVPERTQDGLHNWMVLSQRIRNRWPTHHKYSQCLSCFKMVIIYIYIYLFC